MGKPRVKWVQGPPFRAIIFFSYLQKIIFHYVNKIDKNISYLRVLMHGTLKGLVILNATSGKVENRESC